MPKTKKRADVKPTAIEPIEASAPIAEAAPQPVPVKQQIPNRDPNHGGRFIKNVIYGNFTQKYTYGFVDTDRLLVDRTYQRALDTKRVTQMANAWDQNLAGELVVSLRANKNFYIIDGQHRHGAIQLMANAPSSMYSRIYEGLTLEEEARLFRELDTKRHGLTSGAAFKAALVSGDTFAVEIAEAAKTAGMSIEYGRKGAGSIRSFKTVQDIHRRRGKDFLARVLTIVNKAWPDHHNSASSGVIVGLEVFLTKYPDAKDERLVSIFSEREPAWIETQGRLMNGTLSSAYTTAVGFMIYQLYNRGMRSRKLPEWKW